MFQEGARNSRCSPSVLFGLSSAAVSYLVQAAGYCFQRINAEPHAALYRTPRCYLVNSARESEFLTLLARETSRRDSKALPSRKATRLCTACPRKTGHCTYSCQKKN